MNYQELVNAAMSYADRNDVEVSDTIDTFIIMAEAQINRVLKTREQSTRAFTPTITDEEYYPLPPDYRGMRDIQITTDSPLLPHSIKQLNKLSPSQMNAKYYEDGKAYYCILANQIQLYPAAPTGMAIEMVYYQKVPNLNDGSGDSIDEDSTTNWLSEEHPDIYLSGLCAEIEAFAKNYEVAGLWKSRMDAAIQELTSSDEEEVSGSEPLQIRIES